MTKTLALYQQKQVVPKPPPWDKYIAKAADYLIDQVEAQSYKILTRMANAGDPSAMKILTEVWKTTAEEQWEEEEDDE